MARRGRKTNGDEVIEPIALLPWWAALLLALASYWVFHALARLPPVALARPDQFTPAMIRSVVVAVALVLQFVAPIVCLAAALVSAPGRYKRSQLVARVASSNAAGVLEGMTWQDFELLVGEAFRLQGFAVEERGGAAADGGVDLVLRRDGRRHFVQCKQWKALQVGVPVVR